MYMTKEWFSLTIRRDDRLTFAASRALLFLALTIVALPCSADHIDVYPVEILGQPAITIGDNEVIVVGGLDSSLPGRSLIFAVNPKTDTGGAWSHLFITPDRIAWRGHDPFEISKAEAKWIVDWSLNDDSAFGMSIATSVDSDVKCQGSLQSGAPISYSGYESLSSTRS